jgi:hypothetical protein
MMVAGLEVPDRLVPELARRLREAELEETAVVLEDAYDHETRLVALTITDREAILRVLEDAPDELAELRGACCASTSGGCAKGSSRRA